MEQSEVKDYLHFAEVLLNGEHSQKRTEWESIAAMVAPELLNAAYLRENNEIDSERTCPEAAECADKLTGAHMSYLTPMGHYWFRYSAWGLERKDLSDEEQEEIALWFAKLTDAVKEAVERSNFYDEILSTFYDRVVTGTGALLCEEDTEAMLPWFTYVPMGTFAVANDARRMPNNFVRELKMTAAQIAEEFPDAELSPQVLTALNKGASRCTDLFDVVHIIRPRKGWSRKMYSKYNPDTYPFESVYIEKSGMCCLSESGYHEFPVLVTRYSTAGSQVYGTSPFVKAKDILEDLRLLSDVAIESAKKKVMPPVLVPPELAGQVDIGAGGVTILPAQYTNANVPREWALSGDVRELLEQMERLKNALRAITQVDYLEIISGVDREMTAREVIARQGERVMAYARTFTQFKTDFAPFLLCILNCCQRLGVVRWDDAPEALLDENGKTPEPRVLYVGRMAQSMEQAQGQAIDEVVTRIYELSSLTQNAGLAMVIDEEKVARGQAIAAGMPSKYLRSVRKIKELKEEVKQATEQRQMAQDNLAAAQTQEHAANAYRTIRETEALQ